MEEIKFKRCSNKYCTNVLVNKDNLLPSSEFRVDLHQKSGLRSRCRQCDRDYSVERYYKNIDRIKEYQKQRYLKNKEKSNLQSHEYYLAHKEERKKYAKELRLKNIERYRAKDRLRYEMFPEKDNAKQARRKASKLQRIPSWSTLEMKKDIEFFYKIREEMLNPKLWHIDHYYPLKGKTGSGLHVPWNLRLCLKSENLAKTNKSPEEFENDKKNK